MALNGRSARKALEKKKPLSPKDAVILAATVSGASPQKAVAQAGYKLSRENAETMVSIVKSKHCDQNGQLMTSLDQAGVSLDVLAGKIKEGLNATTTAKSGSEIVRVPDYNIRHKYLETALDVMGAKAPTKSVVEQVKTHEQTIAIVEGINASPQVLAALRRRLETRTITVTETGPSVEGVA